MKNVMVDLETLSSSNRAAIVSIGAVEFDLDAGQLGTSYYVNIEPDERCEISGRTVMWWLEQSKEAQARLAQEPRMKLREALVDFAKWFPKGATLWGNGATFDNVILRHAYNVCNVTPPWHYRDDRCFRTMKAMLPQVMWPEHGVAHDALADAIAQAKYLIDAWKAR